MERLSFTIAKGTTAVLEKKAVKKKIVKGNGRANITKYIRYLLEKDTGVEQCKD